MHDQAPDGSGRPPAQPEPSTAADVGARPPAQPVPAPLTGDDGPADLLPRATASRRQRLGAKVVHLRHLWPWLSLISGCVGGLVMNRSPDHAWYVVASTLAAWGALLALVLMARVDASKLQESHAKAVRAAVYFTRLLSQGATQHLLLFALPFYIRASQAPGHLGFVALICAGAGITLWDPLYEACLSRPLAGSALKGLASFAGLNVVLPAFSVSNGHSLEVAGWATALVLPWAVWVDARSEARLRTWGVALVALSLPLALAFPTLRRLIPAAPLRLEHAAIGTVLINGGLANPLTSFVAPPPQLLCFTRVTAPIGLRDALFHVWRHNGVEVDRIRLQVRGGATRGYRTWSIKQRLGEHPKGLWRCEIQTESGQVLGGTATLIESDAAAPLAMAQGHPAPRLAD